MPQDRLFIREEMRTLGAIQIMTGVINHNLGIIWMYLYISHVSAFGAQYTPVALITGYPFSSSLCFFCSGAFAVVVQKKRSILLIPYTIALNIISACVSILGLWILVFELSFFQPFSEDSPWMHKSGSLLSWYLLLFSFLECLVASIVTEWAYKAKRGR